MATFQWFASLVLAAAIVPALTAETHCPGNVASVPFHFVNRHLMVLAVSINHTGPYDFLLDSGTQITMIDPSLAAALHLETQGAAVVTGVGSGQSASYAQLDLVEAGSHAVTNQKVLVYDLQNLHSAESAHCGAFWGGFPRALRPADRQCAPPALSGRLGGDARRGERAAYPAGCYG